MSAGGRRSRAPFGAAIVILIAATWIFGAITRDVANGDPSLRAVDLEVVAWMHAHVDPALIWIMVLLSYLGAPVTVIGIAALVGLFLWRRRYPPLLLLPMLAVPAGILLNTFIKHAVQRPRPVFALPLVTLESYSFPSGHAVGATLLYGGLVALFALTCNAGHARIVSALGAALLVVLICFSRVYLGVHYLSDVVAGALEAVVWLTLCLTAVQALRHRRANTSIA